MWSIFSYTICVFFGITASVKGAVTRREALGSVTLFAYGSSSSGDSARGDPVFYADGLAYIGTSALAAASVNTNITFATDSLSTTLPWTITANSTTVTFNETLNMYIIPNTGTYSQVGFASETSLPAGAVSTGFTWMGTSVGYAASESDFQMMFSAVATNQSGVYSLNWDATGATLPDGAFPITLKSTPPTIVTFAA